MDNGLSHSPMLIICILYLHNAYYQHENYFKNCKLNNDLLAILKRVQFMLMIII